MFFTVLKTFWMIFSSMTAIALLITISGPFYKFRAGRYALGAEITGFTLFGFTAKRPLKRAIQTYLQNPLADMILRGEIPDGSTVTVGTDKTGLTFGV